MSKPFLLAALLILGLSTSFLSASGPAAKPAAAPPPKLENLIEQLSNADYHKRDEAERLLQARGEEALPALKKAWDHPNAEARRRIRELFTRLEVASQVAPKRVTLRMTKQPLRTILDAMQKQTGYKVEFWTAPNQSQHTYSCDFHDTPFWQAVDHLCRDANLVVQQSYGDERVILQHQGGYTPHVQHAGAFRFVPTGFQSYRNLDFGVVGASGPAPQRQESLTLTFLVFSEPRIPLLGLGEVRLSAAYDSAKNSMLQPVNNPDQQEFLMNGGMFMVRNRFISRYGNGNRSFMQSGQLQLQRPSESASKVKLVRGSIPVTLLIEQKQVAVADNILKAKGKKNTIGSTTFHVDDVTVQANKQIAIKLTINEDNKDAANDWSWMNTMLSRLELLDDKGKKFQNYGTHWHNTAPNSLQLTLTYGTQPNVKMGAATKFIFYQWRTLQHQVDFEFKDLPLP